MGLDGDYQPLLPNGNGKQLSQLSTLNAAEFSVLNEDKFDLRRLLAVARRRIILVAGVAIAVTSGMTAKVLRQVPVYEGKFQLLVGPVSSSEDKLGKLAQSLNEGGGGNSNAPDYETQIQVLWSHQVLSKIVKEIQTRYRDIDENTLRSQLQISRLGETKILEVRYQDSNPEKIQFVLERVAQGYINYSSQEQQDSVTQGLDFVNEQTKNLQKRVNELQQSIQSLRENYKIVDPESQGQQLSNRASEIVKQRQETESQLGEAQKLYTELQNQLSQLGVTPNQAIASSALSEAPRYQQLLNQLSEVESKIAKESARLTEDNPIIQKLLEERQRLKPLVDQEAAKVIGNAASGVPDNPESLASPSSIRKDLTQKLVDTQNQIQVLEVRRNKIANAESVVGQQLKALPDIARRYTDLQQQLKGATESLGRFLTVQETLQVEKARTSTSWKKITGPQKPQVPISPNVPRGVLLGIVTGLIAGAGVAFLAEKLDKVFHSPDELKDSTGLPILGTIPFTKKLKEDIGSLGDSSMVDPENLEFQLSAQSYGYNASPLLESFRSLNTNLQFVSPDEAIRSVVISSATPGDGKSTVTTLLAQAAAAMGQRVLLIDADLRRPRIHETTDLPNVWGLSNVISSEINFEDVIQRSPIEDNLFVLTAGQIPPDPTRLLSSKKMKNLVERFQEAYDLVIFDTPPLLGLADAKLLATHTDGIVMVVGLGKTDRSVFKEVLYGLRTSHARVLGVVANGVKGYTTSTYDQYLRHYTQASQRKLSEERRLPRS